jgi:hypothetical protein
MLQATRDIPVRQLPSGPALSDPGEASALDRLLGWLTGAEAPPDGDRYPGPAPHD